MCGCVRPAQSGADGTSKDGRSDGVGEEESCVSVESGEGEQSSESAVDMLLS